MENRAEKMLVDPEIQRICSMFHFGWIPKKEVGYLERNLSLYREVEHTLSLMGYELVNPPHCEWYLIRLKKEFDKEAFDQFYKRNRDFNRRHMALITILYAKLILPKKLGHVELDADLYTTFEEINLNYGDKFQIKRLSPQKTMETLLKVLKKHYFIIENQGRYYPGPALFMLHNDLLLNINEAIITRTLESISSTGPLEEEGDDVD